MELPINNILELNILASCYKIFSDTKNLKVDTDTYQVFINDKGDRFIRGKDNKFHMYFRKSDGFTAKWGMTFRDDPAYNPYGNEIADIEITKCCRGIRVPNGDGSFTRKPCVFCVPAGTLIQTPNGDVPIEQIIAGDYVLGYDFQNNRPQIQEVKETYIREYSGELVCIETEDGKIVKLTPNHPVMLSNGKQVLAKDLKNTDDVITW